MHKQIPIKSDYVHRKLNHLFNQSYLAHFPLDDFNIYDSYIVFGLISTRFLQVVLSVPVARHVTEIDHVMCWRLASINLLDVPTPT